MKHFLFLLFGSVLSATPSPSPSSAAERPPVLSTAHLTVHRQVALLAAIERDQEDVVRSLVVDDPTFDPSFNDNEAIRRASRLRGRASIIRLLLHNPKVDPAACDNEAIREAAANGDQQAVFALLATGRVDPGARDSEALRRIVRAAEVHDRAAVVQQMLAYPSVDPSANDNEAVIAAACTDAHGVLRLLLADQRVDPGARGNEALLSSVLGRSYDCFKQLLDSARVDPFVRGLEVLRLIAQEDRAAFMKGFLRHARVQSRADRQDVLGVALQQTMARSAMVTAGAFLALGHATEMLWAAVRFGDRPMVEYLLTLQRLDVGELLRMAASHGEAWIVRRCLEHPRLSRGAGYAAALEGALQNGHEAVVGMLNEHKSKPPAGPSQPAPRARAPRRQPGSGKGRVRRPAPAAIVEAAAQGRVLVPRSPGPPRLFASAAAAQQPAPQPQPPPAQMINVPSRRGVASGKKTDKPGNAAPAAAGAADPEPRCDLFTRKHKAADTNPSASSCSSSTVPEGGRLPKRRRLGSAETITARPRRPDDVAAAMGMDSMYQPVLPLDLLLSAAKEVEGAQEP